MPPHGPARHSILPGHSHFNGTVMETVLVCLYLVMYNSPDNNIVALIIIMVSSLWNLIFRRFVFLSLLTFHCDHVLKALMLYGVNCGDAPIISQEFYET